MRVVRSTVPVGGGRSPFSLGRTAMRFKATDENLTIHVSPDELAECIRSVVRCLVPHHTRKVYLFTESRPSFPVEDAGVALVGAIDLPSNFLQSFRIM